MSAISGRMETLLDTAARLNATALHVGPGVAPRARIQGELHLLDEPGLSSEAAAPEGVGEPVAAESIEAFLDAIVPPESRSQLEKNGEGEFPFLTSSGRSAVASVYRSMGAWKIVFLLRAPSPASASAPIR